MCTYIVETIPTKGSAKSTKGWIDVDRATVSFDHPVHAMTPHTLNIDVTNSKMDASYRVALELDANSARNLANTILAVLEEAPLALQQ